MLKKLFLDLILDFSVSVTPNISLVRSMLYCPKRWRNPKSATDHKIPSMLPWSFAAFL